MKNLKKILVVVCILAVFATTFVMSSLADSGYTGTVRELDVLLSKAETAAAAADDYTVLESYNAIAKYLALNPVDESAEGYAEILERSAAVSVPQAQKLLATIETEKSGWKTAVTADELIEVGRILSALDIPADTEGLAEVNTAFDTLCIEYAAKLFDLIDSDIITTGKTASNQVAINRMNSFLTYCQPRLAENASAYSTIEAELPALIEAQETAKANNYAALDDENSLEDYDKEFYFSYDYNTTAMTRVNSNTTIAATWGGVVKKSVNYFGIAQETDGNRYVFVEYNPGASGYDTQAYLNAGLASYEDSQGYVIEFDITCFDAIPAGGINIEPGSISGTFPQWFYMKVTAEGDINDGGYNNSNCTVMLENAIVLGEWLHITIIYNPATVSRDLYVEGEYLCTTTCVLDGFAYELQNGSFRPSANSTTGDFAIDNFTLYSGTRYRVSDRISSMTNEEKMKYYVDYLCDEDRDVNGRYLSYQRSGKLLTAFWEWIDYSAGDGKYVGSAVTDTELQEAVQKYLAFDIDSMMSEVKLSNLNRYKSMIEELEGYARSTSSTITRQTVINDINDFALTYKDAINKELDSDGNGETDYVEYNRRLNVIANEVVMDENASLFVKYMNRFEKVTTLAALERYYSKAKALIDDGLVDSALASNPEHPAYGNFTEFVKAYNESYVNAKLRLEQVRREENSQRILTCIGAIDCYTTEEEWLANFDYIDGYLDIVKIPILGKDDDGGLLYDDTYPGVIEAVAFFNEAYEYFYNVHQRNHITYMNGLLEDIASTDSYIEKMGLAALIRRYLETNDINMNNAEIMTIVNNLETCEAELVLRREDYAKVLVQNAVYFVNTVEKMRTAETYSEQKAYFEEATILYYNFDISVDGAAEAVEIYEEFDAKLTLQEQSSIIFLESMALYKAAVTEDERYAALVVCYETSANAELTYAGVSEALAEYQTIYNEYMNYANSVNGDIISSGNIVGSLRLAIGLSPVVSAIIAYVFGV